MALALLGGHGGRRAGGGSASAPPGGLLAPDPVAVSVPVPVAVPRPGPGPAGRHAAHLHRVGRRHDLRPAGRPGSPQRACTRSPTTPRARPRRATTPSDTDAVDDDPALLGAADRRRAAGCCPASTPSRCERALRLRQPADTDFVLDRVGHVVVGCGTSGHGFKFGPLLGELLADLAEGDRPAVDLAPLPPHRAGPDRTGRPSAGSRPVGCARAPLRRPAPQRERRRPRPHRHERAAGLLRGLGYSGVTTYIQTGNILFSAGIEERGEARGGHRGAAGGGLRRLAGGHPAHRARIAPYRAPSSPYAKAGADPNRHHVTFLATAPTKETLAALILPPSGADELVVDGREVYVHTPDGYAETKYTGTFLERRLGVVSTTRNWNTVTKLGELSGEALRRSRTHRIEPWARTVDAGGAQRAGARRRRRCAGRASPAGSRWTRRCAGAGPTGPSTSGWPAPSDRTNGPCSG